MDIQNIVVFLIGVVAGIVADFAKDYFVRIGKTFILQRAQSKYIRTSVPLPDKDFRCFRFGNFEIPAMPVIGSPETPFHYNEVTVHYRPQLTDFPVELTAARPYLLEKLRERYKVKNLGESDFLPRIDNIEQGPEMQNDKRGHLDIYLSYTTFADQCITNRSLDYRVIPKLGLVSEFIVNQTIREAYCLPPYDDLSKSILANAPGVDTVVISRNLNQNPKDQLIIRKRSESVLFYRGFYQVSATGYMSLAHHSSDGIPSPFITSITEAHQEVSDGLSLSPDDFNLIGLSIDWQDMYPTFYGYVETGLSVQELLGDFRRDAYEGTLYAIPFEPKAILSHIAKEKWTAQGALAAISALLAFYPRKEVESIARTLPAKTSKDFLTINEITDTVQH